MYRLLSSIKIGVRLAIAFAAVAAFLAALSIASDVELSRVFGNVEEVNEHTIPSLQAIAQMEAASTRVRRYHLIHVLAASAEQKADANKTMESEIAKFAAAHEQYDKRLVADEHDRQNLAELDAAWQTYLAAWRQMRPLSDQALNDAAAFSKARAQIVGPNSLLFRKVSAALDAMRDYKRQLAEGAAQQAQTSFTDARELLLVGSGAILVLLVVLAFAITRSVTAPLVPAVQAANAIAHGDLTAPIAADGKDEIAELMHAMGEMRANLERLIGDILASVESVAGASKQIAEGNRDLSARTEAQASSLEQTVASMEELTTAVRRNVESSQAANELASATTQIASEGGDAVQRAVATMSDISAASKKISEIIGVINDIAFQTNILALNAGVEAARAGAQGRGFAVVAAEVRRLAQRAAEAAKQIQELIRTSVERVEAGVTIVQEAGGKMTKIVESAHRVSTLVEEISVASREQAAGIDQINVAISRLDGATQQNAALVEQSAAAAASLSEQARALRGVVAAFHTPQGADTALSTPNQ